jgi:hypothetical protein
MSKKEDWFFIYWEENPNFVSDEKENPEVLHRQAQAD